MGYRKGSCPENSGSSCRSFIPYSWELGSLILFDTLPKLFVEHILCAKVTGPGIIDDLQEVSNLVLWAD